MAFRVDSEAMSSSQLIICDLCADVREAKNHCDDCLANLCDICAQSHEKTSTEPRHVVLCGTHNYNLEPELCSFEEQKEELLDRLNDVTIKTETVSHLPDDIQSMTTGIELKWLASKELIQQEFASLLDTITTQQLRLMASMEEEVQRSLQCLKQLQQDHDKVMSDSCQLVDECISAVQIVSQDDFLSIYQQLLNSLSELESNVDGLGTALGRMPAFLRVPFSLHREKLHLHNCLQFSTFDCQNIKVKEYYRFVPFDCINEELSLSALIETPSADELPPSTCVQYSVQIYCDSKSNKRLIWSSTEAVNSMDKIINGSHGCKLLPGTIHLVKICPTITCTSHLGDKSVNGKVVSLFIATEEDPGTSCRESSKAVGDSQHQQPPFRGGDSEGHITVPEKTNHRRDRHTAENADKLCDTERDLSDCRLRLQQCEAQVLTLSETIKNLESEKRELEGKMASLCDGCKQRQACRVSEQEETSRKLPSETDLGVKLETQTLAQGGQQQEQLSIIGGGTKDDESSADSLKDQNQPMAMETRESEEKQSKLSELTTEKSDCELTQQSLEELEERVASELKALHSLKSLFVQNLQVTLREHASGSQEGEDASCCQVHKREVSFLEQNLEQLTKVHKQLVRDNADLRCEAVRLERCLTTCRKHNKILQDNLKEARKTAKEDIKQSQMMRSLPSKAGIQMTQTAQKPSNCSTAVPGRRIAIPRRQVRLKAKTATPGQSAGSSSMSASTPAGIKVKSVEPGKQANSSSMSNSVKVPSKDSASVKSEVSLGVGASMQTSTMSLWAGLKYKKAEG